MHTLENPLGRLLTHTARHRAFLALKQGYVQSTPQVSLDSDAPTTHPIPKAVCIASQLEELGLHSAMSQKISDTYLKAAHELHTVCEASLRAAFRKAVASKGSLSRQEAQTMHKTWNAAYAQQTRIWADEALSRARESVANARSAATAHVQPSKDKKPVFNHEYTPLLEKYFEYNAYPSTADRAVLARKSMMTLRQIEVWFQNHRNRAKRDGKPLRKLTEDPLPLEISLKSLERKMPFFTIPESERKPPNEPEPQKNDFSDDEDDSLTPAPMRNSSTPDVLNPPRPTHAFPASYPPRCDYNPFPCNSGTHSFPAPVWYRKPATPHRPSKTPVDIDEFITEFQTKLHLRVPVSKGRSKPNRSWCAGRAMLPLPAPHPALIRCPIASTSARPSRLQAVPAPPSRLHPFRSPSPFSSPTSFTLPQHNTTPTRRKVAGIPKRTPKNTSIHHRRGSPAMSEASPPPSRPSSAASRISSSGSDTTLDRRPSSSSSSSSSPSSALTTPIMPTSELPEGARSPLSISGVDFSSMDDLFGSRAGAHSPIEGIPFNFSMTQPKGPHPSSSFETPSAGHLGSRRSTCLTPSTASYASIPSKHHS